MIPKNRSFLQFYQRTKAKCVLYLNKTTSGEHLGPMLPLSCASVKNS